jgi:hypothetical protein
LIVEAMSNKLNAIDYALRKNQPKWLVINVKPLQIEEACRRLNPHNKKLPHLFCIYPDRDQYHPLILKELRHILTQYKDFQTVIIEQIPYDILREKVFTTLKELNGEFSTVDFIILNNISQTPLSQFKTLTGDDFPEEGY